MRELILETFNKKGLFGITNNKQFCYFLKTIYPNSTSIKESLYRLLNNIIDIPTCKYCQKTPTKFKSFKDGYRDYCSYKCSNKAICSNPTRINKIKQTKKNRYGDENYTNVEKRKQTNLNRYGVDNPQKNKVIKQKTIITTKLKYGDNCFKQIAKSPRRNRNNYKRGTENFSTGKEFFLRITNKTEDDLNDLKIALSENLTSPIKYIAQKLNWNYKTCCLAIKKFNLDDSQFRSSKIYTNNISFDPIKLKELYDIQSLTQQEISILADCSPTSIWRRMKQFNIKCRAQTYVSSYENEIVKFLNSVGIYNIIRNSRDIIPPFELDIFIPDFNFAIEFNGDYWHTYNYEECHKHKMKHQNKTLDCLKHNIQLLNIKETDWNNNKLLLQSIILNKINIFKENIYARNCEIKEVDIQTSKKFLHDNHLQGYANSNIKLGLYYNSELVSLMTFGKSRYESGCIELIRFCNKKYTKVIGGASKLLKYFEKKYKPNKIVTYADLEYSQGKLYNKLGFELSHITKPSYMYFDGYKYQNRQKFQKKKLMIPDDITEQNFVCNILGYRIYWTCGNMVFYKFYTN